MIRGFVWAEGGVLCQRPVNMLLLSRCVIQKMYKFHFFFVRVSVRTRVPGAGYALANTLRYCVFSHCNIIKMFYTESRVCWCHQCFSGEGSRLKTDDLQLNKAERKCR